MKIIGICDNIADAIQPAVNSLLMGSHYQMRNSKPGRNVAHVFGPALNYPKASFVEITPTTIEGPEKATRGGVNGSQSKFLTGTWPISQNQPETPLF
jgi:hypothetical protein